MNKKTAWAAALALPMLMTAAAQAQPAAAPGTTVPNAAPGGISPGAPAPAMRAPGNTGPASPAEPSAAGVNPNAPSAPAAGDSASLSAADKRFVMKAAVGGMAEVQLAQLAQQKSQSDNVKQFAQKMIDDHTPNNEQLAKIASGKGVTAPTELDAMHQKEMTKLQALNGAKFDKMYLSGQAKDHLTMLKLFQTEAKSGHDADLKSFAEATIPTIQSHEDMAKSDMK